MALAASVALAPATALLAPQPAAAETIYPSGCVANHADWSTNCWVGYSYDTYSSLVLAAQYELGAFGFNPGSKDCTYGSQTSGAVQRFQQEQGLSVDGVIGTNTWTHLNAKLGLEATQVNGSFYYFYYNAYADIARYVKIDQVVNGQLHVLGWGVYDPFTTPAGYFEMAPNNGSAACPFV